MGASKGPTARRETRWGRGGHDTCLQPHDQGIVGERCGTCGRGPVLPHAVGEWSPAVAISLRVHRGNGGRPVPRRQAWARGLGFSAAGSAGDFGLCATTCRETHGKGLRWTAEIKLTPQGRGERPWPPTSQAPVEGESSSHTTGKPRRSTRWLDPATSPDPGGEFPFGEWAALFEKLSQAALRPTYPHRG